ncbi:MAG: hypothetical protein ACFFDU_05580 [Candidatus Thorarchaeota archaeon]
MSDETASTLVFIGAIFQLLATIALMVVGGLGFILPIIFGAPLDFWLLIPAFFFIGGIISLIFAILWFSWRHEPSLNKTSLIITGVLALIFGGFLPGLLVLIGGAIAGGESA